MTSRTQILLSVLVLCTYVWNTEGTLDKKHEVKIEINRITPYLGDKDVIIRCQTSGFTIKKGIFLSINLETTFSGPRPLVTLTQTLGTPKIEWASYLYDRYQNSKRINATGQLSKPEGNFLELRFSAIECSDEGVYECVYEGYDEDGKLEQATMKGELIVYSYHDRPHISVSGAPRSSRDLQPVEVKAGDTVEMLCEGVVGKPPVPMVWQIMDVRKDKSYRELTEKEGILGKGFRERPIEDLCRFKAELPLNFTMPEVPDDSVMLSCRVGYSSATVMFTNPKRAKQLRKALTAHGDARALSMKEENKMSNTADVGARHAYVTVIGLLIALKNLAL